MASWLARSFANASPNKQEDRAALEMERSSPSRPLANQSQLEALAATEALATSDVEHLNMMNSSLPQTDLGHENVIKPPFSPQESADENVVNTDFSDTEFANDNVINTQFSPTAVEQAKVADTHIFPATVENANLDNLFFPNMRMTIYDCQDRH